MSNSTNSHTRGDAFEYYRALGPSKDDEATLAINELVLELGEKCVCFGVNNSRIGHLVGKQSASQEAQAVAVTILARIIDSEDPRKEADVMALSCGLLLREGATITDVARKHGVSKQDISKSVVAFCEKIGLPPSHVMLPEAARERYAMANKRNYSNQSTK